MFHSTAKIHKGIREARVQRVTVDKHYEFRSECRKMDFPDATVATILQPIWREACLGVGLAFRAGSSFSILTKETRFSGYSLRLSDQQTTLSG